MSATDQNTTRNSTTNASRMQVDEPAQDDNNRNPTKRSKTSHDNITNDDSKNTFPTKKILEKNGESSLPPSTTAMMSETKTNTQFGNRSDIEPNIVNTTSHNNIDDPNLNKEVTQTMEINEHTANHRTTSHMDSDNTSTIESDTTSPSPKLYSRALVPNLPSCQINQEDLAAQ